MTASPFLPSDGVMLVAHTDATYIAEQLKARVPGLRVQAVDDPKEAVNAPNLEDVVAYFAYGSTMSDKLFSLLPRLRWIQFLTSGTDQLASFTNVKPGTLVTSVRGAHGAAVSEMALTHMLALSRHLPLILANQRAHKWNRFAQPLLNGKTAVIIGTGFIAQELAKRCRAFGMKTVGVTSTPRSIDGFDSVVARDNLVDVAASADFLVALVPLSKDTLGLVDERIFGAMKPSAYFINVARGPVVVEADLLDALRSGRIAGAGLDVFQTEPVAPDHPFWDMTNVIMTPHMGGESDRYADQVMPIVERNLKCFIEGRVEDMINRSTT